jgi:hypothetical protein
MKLVVCGLLLLLLVIVVASSSACAISAPAAATQGGEINQIKNRSPTRQSQ